MYMIRSALGIRSMSLTSFLLSILIAFSCSRTARTSENKEIWKKGSEQLMKEFGFETSTNEVRNDKNYEPSTFFHRKSKIEVKEKMLMKEPDSSLHISLLDLNRKNEQNTYSSQRQSFNSSFNPYIYFVQRNKIFSPAYCLILSIKQSLQTTSTTENFKQKETYLNYYTLSSEKNDSVESSPNNVINTDKNLVSPNLECQISTTSKEYAEHHMNGECYDGFDNEFISILRFAYGVDEFVTEAPDNCQFFNGTSTVLCSGPHVKEVPSYYESVDLQYLVFDGTSIYCFDKLAIERLPISETLAILNGLLVKIEPKYLQDHVTDELIIYNTTLQSWSFSWFYLAPENESNITLINLNTNYIHFLVSTL